MPFNAQPGPLAPWYPWGTDVHNIVANALYEPVARYLPTGYVAGTTDIAPYVQAAADAIVGEGRGALLLPPGTHLWNSSVYLDAATRELVYELRGHGRGTVIQLGSALNGGFAVYVNQNSSAVQGIASPEHPRLIFQLMEVDGQSGTRGLIFTNEGSCVLENLRLLNLYRGVQTTGYTDFMTLRKIHWQPGTVTGAICYYNHGNGDGLVIEQVMGGDDSVIADVANCNGASIISPIVGGYVFDTCDSISVISAHNDGGDNISGYQQTSWFTIKSSRVSFYGGWHQIGDTASGFEINDTSTIRHSEVLWDNFSFGFRPHTATKVRAADVKVTSAQPMTRLRFRRCSGTITPAHTANIYAGGAQFTATDSNILAAWTNNPTALLEDCDLVQTDLGWQFISAPPAFGRNFLRVATTPTISAAVATVSPGNQTNGTYFYKACVYTDKTRSLHTASSTEASATITSSGQSVQLTTTTGINPALIRMWRGTTTGTYDRYADVTMSGYQDKITDTGPNLNGVPWVTTSVPTPPTTNTTMDGRVVGREAVFQGSGIPVEGTWGTGDRVDNTTPSTGIGGWRCTSGGTPGTWAPTGLATYTATLASDVSVTATTTVADTALSIAGVPPGTYHLSAGLSFISPTTADVKYGFTLPSASSGLWAPNGVLTSTTVATGGAVWNTQDFSSSSNNVAIGGFTSAIMSNPSGRLTLTNTGNVTVRFAQNTSDAGTTTLQAGSWLTLIRIA